MLPMSTISAMVSMTISMRELPAEPIDVILIILMVIILQSDLNRSNERAVNYHRHPPPQRFGRGIQ